jgi:hypothetical protein
VTPELEKALAAATPELRALALRTLEEYRRYLAIAASLTPNTARAMTECVDDKLMADLVSDFRSGVARPASMASTPDAPQPAPRKGTGFVDPIPLRPPPGVEICDRLVDAADARDRRSEFIDQAIRSKLKG